MNLGDSGTTHKNTEHDGAAAREAGELENGYDLRALPAGTNLEIRTAHSVYHIRLAAEGEILIKGHAKHCPDFTPTPIVGSVLVTGQPCDGYLATGMRMEFRIGTRRVVTSRVDSITILR